MLAEDSIFDLAHVPVLFIPAEHVREGLQRVWTALRPGGWLLLQVVDAKGDELGPAVLRLLGVLWGGADSMTTAQAEQILVDAEYREIRAFPSTAWPARPLRRGSPVIGEARTQPR